MKTGGLGNSLLIWLLVSGGLHAAVLWGAGGFGHSSGDGTDYIEVALAPSTGAAGRSGEVSNAPSSGAVSGRSRPPSGAASVNISEAPVTVVPASPIPTTIAAPLPRPTETGFPEGGASDTAAGGSAVPAATEDSAGAGDGAAGAVGGVATGEAIGGDGGSGPAGEGGGGSVRTPPRCIEMRQPSYPQDARRLRWEGEVKLRLHVASDGSVREVRVAESSGHDLLDRAARDAAGRWKFQPARLGPVPVEDDAVFVTVGFELDRN